MIFNISYVFNQSLALKINTIVYSKKVVSLKFEIVFVFVVAKTFRNLLESYSLQDSGYYIANIYII